MREIYLNEIKSFEGFTAQAKWDYAQFTNGYGTKARFEGEKIDQAEAERRFAAELAEARKFVDRHTEGWDEGTKAALTSLTFNAGTRWASSGLGDAIRSFDVNAVRERFLAYTKAGGIDLPGLVKRRLEEVTWIGNDGDIQPPKADGTIATPLPVTPAAIAGDEAMLVRKAEATVTAAPASRPVDGDPLHAAIADPRAMASLSLILLALDLAAAPSPSRRGEQSDSKPESA